MNAATVVGDFFSTETGSGVRLVNHETTSSVIRSKVVLQNYLFSLLVEGTKIVHTARHSISVDSEKFFLLLPGNYLMTEKHTSGGGRFQSVLLFFTQEVLNAFFSKHPESVAKAPNASFDQFQVFTKDRFLENFIQSLLLMIENGKETPSTLQLLKLEELLLYLCYRFPQKMQQLKSKANISTIDEEIMKTVESNVGNNINIEELAFLCNLSLSTFKRKFIKLYGIAPSKWFLQRKMELATTLLRTRKEKPGEVYHKVGYESHSSFSHSFKQVFGITPTEYRERMM
jgi:AraC family transcriptional regulator, exoenzyme S synthesis regulatory protein ExsA